MIWVIETMSLVVAACVMLLVSYYVPRVTITWPTQLGIDGTWQAFLALCTAGSQVVWFFSVDWESLIQKGTRWIAGCLTGPEDS